jgi:hypothetical protein
MMRGAQPLRAVRPVRLCLPRFYRDGYGKDFTILNLEDDDKQKRT